MFFALRSRLKHAKNSFKIDMKNYRGPTLLLFLASYYKILISCDVEIASLSIISLVAIRNGLATSLSIATQMSE